MFLGWVLFVLVCGIAMIMTKDLVGDFDREAARLRAQINADVYPRIIIMVIPVRYTTNELVGTCHDS